MRALHARIANRRKDALHKLSTDLVRRFELIAVGDVNASALAKTRLAKSVLDAGWSGLRDMLRYKGEHAGRHVLIVPEHHTTQDCSACGARAGPKGLQGLAVQRLRCRARPRHQRGGEHPRSRSAAARRTVHDGAAAGSALRPVAPPGEPKGVEAGGE